MREPITPEEAWWRETNDQIRRQDEDVEGLLSFLAPLAKREGDDA